jgi:hypothetical protein
VITMTKRLAILGGLWAILVACGGADPADSSGDDGSIGKGIGSGSGAAGTTSGGAGGAGGGLATTTTSSSGVDGGPGNEICGNGRDDDGDG